MKTALATLSNDFLDRHFIGWNRLLDDFSNHNPVATSFPPFNIVEAGEGQVDIELAVAGFQPEDISVMVDNGILTIESEKTETEDTEDKNYRYRGISARSFKKSWRLAEYWKVSDAKFDNGILTVSLEQEIPEEHKPKRIDIKTS